MDERPENFEGVGIRIPWMRTGDVKVLCPRCSHARRPDHRNEKCLSVNVDDGVWFCHNCGWKGGLKRDTVAYGAPLPKPAFVRPEPPTGGLPTAIVDWFARRGIPEWVLEENGIVGADDVIDFPYLRGGEVVNIKHRKLPKQFWMEKGAERIFYGLDGAADAETVVIVEGEIDKLSIDAVAGPPCLSVPDGAPAEGSRASDDKFAFMASGEAILSAARKVLIAVDADGPGRALAAELARRIGIEKCWRVTWPEGCKDANDTLVREGAAALLDALDHAAPYPVAGIKSVEEIAPLLGELYDRGLDKGSAVGWPSFDALYRPRPGLLTVITGSPGSGKTYFIDNLLVRLSDRYNWPIGICSPENQPLERHLASLISIHLGLPFGAGPTDRMTRDDLAAGVEWARRRFAFILPEEPSLKAILQRADTLVYRMGIRGLVIDPWNELDHNRPPAMTETEYVSKSLGELRNWARNKGVCVWLVAHPTKLQKDVKMGTYPVATLYDIAGSANFANKADAGMSVWRDPTNPLEPIQVHVQKIRFPETGQVGMSTFRFDKPTGRFFEVS